MEMKIDPEWGSEDTDLRKAKPPPEVPRMDVHRTSTMYHVRCTLNWFLRGLEPAFGP